MATSYIKGPEHITMCPEVKRKKKKSVSIINSNTLLSQKNTLYWIAKKLEH